MLTGQLAVGALAGRALAASPAAPAAAEAGAAEPLPLAAAWLAWVVLLNGGTLAYNSAFDRDTRDIAYLRRPPPPPPGLAGRALALMLAGVAVAAAVSPALAALTAGCVALSVLYSHPRARLKGVPGLDLAVNALGYGAGTTLAGLLAGATAWGGDAPGRAGWLATAGFGLLFGSLYPLTQLYQIADDRARGDRTLATALGPRRSLALALVLGGAAAPCLLAATARWSTPSAAAWPAVALAAWLLHLVVWLVRAPRLDAPAHERGMYRALALWAAVDLALLPGLLGR